MRDGFGGEDGGVEKGVRVRRWVSKSSHPLSHSSIAVSVQRGFYTLYGWILLYKSAFSVAKRGRGATTWKLAVFMNDRYR